MVTQEETQKELSVTGSSADIADRCLDVCFGPLADIGARISDVRFTPEADMLSINIC